MTLVTRYAPIARADHGRRAHPARGSLSQECIFGQKSFHFLVDRRIPGTCGCQQCAAFLGRELKRLLEQLCNLLPTLRRHRKVAAPAQCRRQERDRAAWLRLVEQREWNLANRSHFFGTASKLMRRILIDHARAAKAEKRGGSQIVVSPENALVVAAEHPKHLLDVHSVLERLEQVDPLRARIVEMRSFWGTFSGRNRGSQRRRPADGRPQWRAARAWLGRELAADSSATV